MQEIFAPIRDLGVNRSGARLRVSLSLAGLNAGVSRGEIG
jgi:hypothetical protein